MIPAQRCRGSSTASAGHDRCRERHPMVLVPGRPQPARGPNRTSSACAPRACGPLGPPRPWRRRGGPPSRGACLFGEYLAVHDRVGVALVRRAPLDGDVCGEVERPGSERHRHDGCGQCGCELVERIGRRAHRRRPHLRDQRRGRDVVQTVCLRGGSVPRPCRVRRVRSAGGPRPRGRPPPRRPRPSRNDGRCPAACHRLCRDPRFATALAGRGRLRVIGAGMLGSCPSESRCWHRWFPSCGRWSRRSD